MNRSLFRFALPLVALTLVAGCGDSPDVLLQKAQANFDAEDYDTARIQVASALGDEPENKAMLTLLARIYMRLGDTDGAEGALHRLEEAGGSSEGLSVLKAEIALTRGYPDRALGQLGGAVSADAWRVRAEADLALDKRNDAITAFEKGLKAGGGIRLAEAYARFRLNCNELDEADAVYKRMVAMNPKAYETLVLAGDLAAARGQRDKAIAAFDTVIAAYPDYVAPRMALASQYNIKGDVDKAMNVVDDADKLGTGKGAIEAMRVQLLAKKGEWRAIRDRLQGREAQLEPGSPLAMTYGEALLHLGHAEQARLIFKRATLELPTNPHAKLMLAISLIETGDSNGAWAILRPMAMSPLAAPQIIDAARQTAEQVGAPEAAQLKARMAPDRVKQTRALIAQAAKAVTTQNWAEAKRLYAPLLAQGEDVEVLKRLAVASSHLGEHAQAKDYADRALRLDPRNPDCLYVAGFVRLNSGENIKEARHLLEQAAAADPRNAIIARELVKAKAAEV